MALYEHIFLVRQDISAQQVEGMTHSIKSYVEEQNGKVDKIEHWGLLNLAYRIRKNRKAHYTLVNIDAPSSVIDEIERRHKLNEDVIRTLTVRVDHFSKEPSPIMEKREEKTRRRT